MSVPWEIHFLSAHLPASERRKATNTLIEKGKKVYYKKMKEIVEQFN